MRTIFRPDEYFIPQTINETISLLQKFGDKARLVGGGTYIHELAERGMLPQVEKLIDAQRLGLTYIRKEKDGVLIGATTTFAEIDDNPAITDPVGYGGIVDVLRHFAPVQVKNKATIAGTVCSGLSFFDLPIALIAVDAEAKVVGPKGERKIPVGQFIVDHFTTDLKTGELVTEFRLPSPHEKTGSAFAKLETMAVDLAQVSAAVRVTLSGENIADSRVVLGAVGRTPIRCTKAEKALDGKHPTESVFEEASKVAASDAKPIGDVRASADYKREMCKVYVKRTLEKAVARIKGA